MGTILNLNQGLNSTSHGARSICDVWRISIDTGGTFTDCIARSPQGENVRCKVLSHAALRARLTEWVSPHRARITAPWIDDLPIGAAIGFPASTIARMLNAKSNDAEPDDDSQTLLSCIGFDVTSSVIEFAPAAARGIDVSTVKPPSTIEIRFPMEAPILAAHLVTQTPFDQPLPKMDIRLATTRGTNALLERQGSPVILFVTKGFQDLLTIGTQQRPDLFALEIKKTEPLPCQVIEVTERIAADGTVIQEIDIQQLNQALDALQSTLPRDAVAAIALLNSYANPAHEAQVFDILRTFGFSNIRQSHEVAPRIGYLARTQTTTVDAYLSTVISAFLNGVRTPCKSGSRIRMMTSAGGLQSAEMFAACDSLFSGPAGGVKGAVQAGLRCGLTKLIAFDMGGTSTDVSRYDGVFEYDMEPSIDSATVMSPALAIHTVAAGGGSVCWFDGHRLRVGPQSAGAQPGPACYGLGGPLTISDVNLMLHRLNPTRFGIPIDLAAANNALLELRDEIEQKTGEPIAFDELLHGFLDIANERMADAVRKISVRRGFDPRDYTMVGFGGAGGQHACAVATRLGIPQILIPPHASLLSAEGLAKAPIEHHAERQLLVIADSMDDASLQQHIHELSVVARSACKQDGVAAADIAISRILLSCRFEGQDSTLECDCMIDNHDDFATIGITHCANIFRSNYVEIFGVCPPNRAIEFVALRVIANGSENSTTAVSSESVASQSGKTSASESSSVQNEWPTYERATFCGNDIILGPALIAEDHSITVVESHWQAVATADRSILLTHQQTDTQVVSMPHDQQHTTINLELYSNRLTSIAEEMGEMLRRVALSTNVKERLDFSCAILDADGELVVNAPHIPVHLGALGECVRSVAAHIAMRPGDTVVTNHPAFGGSHLPDVTVITPIYQMGSTPPTLLGYAANRAHHAEVGGIRPGSMPPQATTLVEEGVILQPMYLVEQGNPCFDTMRRLLANFTYGPSRAVDENMEDLRAALAANKQGESALQQLAESAGVPVVAKFMRLLKHQSESRMRTALNLLPNGAVTATEQLDDGTLIKVNVTIQGDEANVDFTGTGNVHPGNLNATPAIVRSALMYVLRLLIAEPMPLNEGLMRPITVNIPENCLLNPHFPEDVRLAPAVVGGNVETSQRIVDALIQAFDLMAGSQGTMNNVLFGNDTFGYYETVAGGTGAGATFDGTDAVHSHMTNTRITDPEILEHRYPVRLHQFAIRTRSGGRGLHHGGNGIIREYEFLTQMQVSILSQHRTHGPAGTHGGDDGLPGSQTVQSVHANGSAQSITLGSIEGIDVQPGDRLILKTPGGGGWGDARNSK